MAKAKAGDTVFVKAGTYKEGVSLKDGISLIGESVDKVVIQCDALSRSVIFAQNCQNIVISNLTFEHIGADDRPDRMVGILIDNSSVEITGCKITKAAGNGIFIYNKSKAVISNCTIIENGFCGIKVDGRDTSATIQDCNIANNTQSGIYFYGQASGKIENNTCEKNEGVGIAITGKGTKATLKR